MPGVHEKIREKIWRGEPAGLLGALLEAERLEREGKKLEAEVMRASANYSYARGVLAPVRLYLARSSVETAVRLAEASDEACESLTHGQCDVIGTLLLRRVLWKRPQPHEAIEFFRMGIDKPDAPPHSKALMYTGIAEAWQLLGDEEASKAYLNQALMLEGDVMLEPDVKQAVRQYIRVLRRAIALGGRLGLPEFQDHMYDKLENYANAYLYGDERERAILRALRALR